MKKAVFILLLVLVLFSFTGCVVIHEPLYEGDCIPPKRVVYYEPSPFLVWLNIVDTFFDIADAFN